MVEFTSLIGDLVALARDETFATPVPLDFRDVVNAALNRVRRRAFGLNFDVELNPFYVVGDSDMLERALTNLLDNAVKWSPPGGTVRVQLEGDRLRVADEGPGIAEADLPFVFDRFYRADTARNTPGTGLGLSIVAQTISQHGGWVKAGALRPGRGRVHRPAARRQQPGGPDRADRTPAGVDAYALSQPTSPAGLRPFAVSHVNPGNRHCARETTWVE